VYRFLLIACFLFVVCAAKAETDLASHYSGLGRGAEMTCAHRTRPFGSVVTVTHAGLNTLSRQ